MVEGLSMTGDVLLGYFRGIVEHAAGHRGWGTERDDIADAAALDRGRVAAGAAAGGTGEGPAADASWADRQSSMRGIARLRSASSAGSAAVAGSAAAPAAGG